MKSDYVLTSDPEVTATVEAASEALILNAVTIVGELLRSDVALLAERFREYGSYDVPHYGDEILADSAYRGGLQRAARKLLTIAFRSPIGKKSTPISRAIYQALDYPEPKDGEQVAAAYRGFLNGEVFTKFKNLYTTFGSHIPDEYRNTVLA